tara:strand:+ start:165 stop:380 length:216 start_codon:yes stop_codon:yes gene_type:complete
MEQIKESVTKLEWRVDSHEEEIKLLKDTSAELRITLDAITLNLRQIKWIAIGAGAAVFANQFGLTAILKFL